MFVYSELTHLTIATCMSTQGMPKLDLIFFSISGSRIAELEMHLLAAKVNRAQSIQCIADQDQTIILVWKKILKRKKKIDSW